MQEHFKEEGQDGQKVDESGWRFGLLDATDDGAFVARLFYASVHAHAVLHREDGHSHGVQDDELQMQDVVDAFDRFQDHGQHRQDHPHANEHLKDVLHGAAEFAWEHQGVHFLTEGAAFVELFEFSNGRNQDAEQLHDSQESQESQHAQVDWDKGLQVERCHSQEVDDGKWAGHKAQAGVLAVFELFVFRREVKAHEIFNGEDCDREDVKALKPNAVRFEHRRHVFEHQGEQVDDDQVADPLVQILLEVAGDVWIEQP